MKFHLVSNQDPQIFIDELSIAVAEYPDNFVQEIKFTTIYAESAPHQQIWTALIIFGEIPSS